MTKADQIRTALADPNSPLYGSDLVPLIADYLDESERATALFAYIQEHEVSDGLIAKRLLWANEAEARIQELERELQDSRNDQIRLTGELLGMEQAQSEATGP
jgi:hypothetical protein